jgi:glycosyltransferase involved in cell wall biosynthesis
MESPIKVSVVVTAYNEEKYIGRCLRSLLSQTFPSDAYEIIVVDDCSDDRTAHALSQFSGAIRVLTNETNRGLPASINLGLRAARGEFATRVDADDFVNTNFLQFLHYYLESNNQADAVACDYFCVNDDEDVLSRENCFDRPIACGIMFRLADMLSVGLYDERFHLREEEEFRIRYESKFKINRLDLPLYRYRQHAGNMTRNIGEMDKFAEMLKTKHGVTD